MTKSSSTTSFYKYMKRWHKNTSPRFGDFTNKMLEDESFPKRKYPKLDEYTMIRRYLEKVGASEFVIETFVDAYHEYMTKTLS